MSQTELLAALEREAQQRINARRTAAAAEEETLQREGATCREARRAAAERRWRSEAERAQQQRAALAQRAARRIRLEAETRLVERLRTLARGLLAELACTSEDCFAQLAAELPPLAWQRLRVHPRDGDAAHRRFPAALIEVDEQVSGGVTAETLDGRIRVDNTLEKRLEQSWDDLLPLVLQEVKTDSAAPSPALRTPSPAGRGAALKASEAK